MSILEILRNKAFWIIDKMRGHKVEKALQLLQKYNNHSISDEELKKYQLSVICELLYHARNTTAFYSAIQSDDISKWPIINKSIIKTRQDEFLSNKYRKEDLFIMSTSGSTGTPFRAYQDSEKKRHVNAEVLYYNGKIGFEVGRKIIYFRSINNEVSKSPLIQLAQNIKLVDCIRLNDEIISKRLQELAEITKNNAAMILSYASTLDAFCRYFQKFGYDKARKCNIYGIVSGSEMLQDTTRKILEDAFNCKCVSRYANEENGFLGQDSIQNNVFIPNNANYYIEIIKLNSDEAAEENEMGRIVVTDLYNKAMPMIRYDTGDIGSWRFIDIKGTKVRTIGNFGGRKVDMVYDCNGNLISPHSITNVMWDFQELKQFQFIQKSERHYVMKINASDGSFNSALLEKRLRNFLGETSIIEFEYCDEIPVLSSGKRRYIVNEMS